MTRRSTRLVRAGFVLFFAALLVATFRHGAALLRAAEQNDAAHFRQVLNFTRSLAGRTDGIFDDAEQRQLQDAALRIQLSLNYWTQYADAGGKIASQAQKDCAAAA